MTNKFSRRGAALLCGAALAVGASSALAQTGPASKLIVKWRQQDAASSSVSSPARAMSDMQARYGVSMRPMRTLSTGGEVIRLSQRLSKAQMQDLVANLNKDPSVEYAEEDIMLRASFTPNDPGYPQQWHYFETAGGLNLPPAWDITTGTGMRVAVIDTGFRPHADLVGNLLPGFDFISDVFVANDNDGRDSDASDPGDFTDAGVCDPRDPPLDSSWHGTHVSGTVAAVTNNGSGVAGVAFGAKVIPVRALGRCGGSLSDIADAIIWASGGQVAGVPNIAARAHVLNLSLGGISSTCSPTQQAAINSARSRGTVVVVAAGNENMNAANATPANCAGVVTVAAVNRSGGRAPYSNFGTIVDVAAPGGVVTATTAVNGVLSTLNLSTTTPGDDAFAFYQGTSMATPHIAGLAALILSRNSALTPDQVENILKTTARAFPQTCSGCGVGIANALAAVQAAVAPTPPPSTVVTALQRTGLSGARGSAQRFSFTVPAGARNLSIQMSGGTGDADLYVRRNAQPTTATFDCAPFLDGNNETCTAATPAAGTYNILIQGFRAYSGVTLRATYTSP